MCFAPELLIGFASKLLRFCNGLRPNKLLNLDEIPLFGTRLHWIFYAFSSISSVSNWSFFCGEVIGTTTTSEINVCTLPKHKKLTHFKVEAGNIYFHSNGAAASAVH